MPKDQTFSYQDELKHFSTTLLLYAFQQLGVFQEIEESDEMHALQKKLNILEKYTRLYQVLLQIMAEAGYITLEEGKVTCLIANKIEESELQHEKAALLAKIPALKAHIELLWSCLMAYPAILTGAGARAGREAQRTIPRPARAWTN